MTELILTAVVAAAASLTTTPLMARLARRVGLIDRPGPRKIHRRPTPVLGGVAVWTGAATGLLAWELLAAGPSPFAAAVGPAPGVVALQPLAAGLRFLAPGLGPGALVLTLGAGLLLVGTLDDAGRLHSQFKLAVAIPLAGLVLVWAGFRLPLSFVPEPALAVLTIVWVVGVTASFSIFDHMDGLCGGVAALAALSLAALLHARGDAAGAALAVAVMGGALGFVVWNFEPARVFLGDGGAMLVGFAAAALTLRAPGTPAPAPDLWMAPVLALAVPIFDTALVIVSRLRRGLVPFSSPGKDHAAHRLANLGLRVRGTVLLLYGLTLAAGVLAVSLEALAGADRYLVLAVAAAAGLLGIAALERAPYERQERPERSGGLGRRGRQASLGSPERA